MNQEREKTQKQNQERNHQSLCKSELRSMGICTSCESTSVATTKLILEDGRLQEFSFPVKVSHVLQKNPSCFVCNSDEMDIGDAVLAVSDEEELQLGQLYFLLPLSLLKHRLQAEEMAALAVKASSALKRSGGYCGNGRRNALVFPGDDGYVQSRKLSGGESGHRRRRSGGGGRSGRTAPRLSAIPE